MPIRVGSREIPLPAGLSVALILVALPLLGLISLQVYEAVTRPRQLALDRAWIAHTFEVIATAEGIKSAAQNAERAERGLLLTGNGNFLQRYQEHLATSRSLLERLRQLTVDNPEEQHRIANVSVALEEWLAERQGTIDIFQRQGPAAAQQRVNAQAGQSTLWPVESLLDGTQDIERDLLARRQQRAADHERRVGEVALASSALATALLLLGIWLTRVAFVSARSAEQQRRATEQQLNEQLIHAQAALAQTQKMEALGQLTGGVAHDFNNLLHVIRNAVTVVQRRVRSADEEVHRYLEMALRNTDRAASTTARLLAFSRQQPLDPTPTDLNKLVAGMADLLRHLLGE